ncbi:MAG: hypothetical protein ACRDLD_02380 [Thermoleophilaceae bacterium]
MTPTVEFTASPRGYRVDGKRVPSVTTVLGSVTNGPPPWWGMTTTLEALIALHAEEES